MASFGMFLASMFLIVAGSVLMWVYNVPPGEFAFVIGLFVVMGGVILFAISLNYGSPPATQELPPVEHGTPGAPVAASTGHASPGP